MAAYSLRVTINHCEIMHMFLEPLLPRRPWLSFHSPIFIKEVRRVPIPAWPESFDHGCNHNETPRPGSNGDRHPAEQAQTTQRNVTRQIHRAVRGRGSG